MKWFWHRCRRRRRDVCLLAAGALGEDERPELERHLAACGECRNYHGEIKALAAPLAGWEKDFSTVEATPAAQKRWARAVQETGAPSGVWRFLLKHAWRIVWGELIRPSRYAWAGMAALWVAMLIINGQLSGPRMRGAGDRASSAQKMIQAWEEQNRVLAELAQPASVIPAPPPSVPRPRSQREQDWAII